MDASSEVVSAAESSDLSVDLSTEAESSSSSSDPQNESSSVAEEEFDTVEPGATSHLEPL